MAKKLPRALQQSLTLSCYAVVATEFATFHNPKMRGDNFTWDKFPDLMAIAAWRNCWMTNVIPDNHRTAAETFAHDTGRAIAQTLVDAMTK